MSTAATSSQQTLVERLDRLESREQIAELLADYAAGFDLQDREALARVWHEDAQLDLGDVFGTYDGRQAILEIVETFYEKTPSMHHWVATPSIRIDGDRATGVMGVDCFIQHVGQGPAMIAGTYYDEYERREGRWGIVRRRFDMHYLTPMKDWVPKFGSHKLNDSR